MGGEWGKRISLVASGEAATGNQLCENCRIYDFFSDANDAARRVRKPPTGTTEAHRGDGSPVLSAESGDIRDACLSDDNRWLAFLLAKPSAQPQSMCLP